MSRLFSRRRGRHCRHGSYTGWAALSQIRPAQGDDFSRRRTTSLAVFPMAAPDYPHPYASKENAA
ncbi:hypothetical protein E1286_04955 [Nonomuraea terrae]|uniref:Uncharacterized protein n=1 Tax=Nonomuraea terrae TaxID=2530383 RepID=A0A4R4ZDU7_9ACTN|nr:hypothetical protein [Nonomuraea terrae]TDD54542.1 hypothetical protein E1286_04955 [Nonomuraea terrae]